MMKNKWKKFLIAAMCFGMFSMGAVPVSVHANANEASQPSDAADNTSTTASDTDTSSGGQADEKSPEKVTPTKTLTPEGNLNLTDDLKNVKSDSMEFLTVTTKNNHTFYLVIEHGKTSNAVHFLSQVDEEELMNLISSEEKDHFVLGKGTVSSVTDDTKSVKETTKKGDEADDDKKADVSDTDQKSASPTQKKKHLFLQPLITLLVFGVIGGIAAGGYYLYKIRPSKQLSYFDEPEYEEEETVNEDLEVLDEESFDDMNEEEKDQEEE